MDEKERCSIEERIRGNCAENRRHIDASRFQDKGQTSRSVQVTSHNFDKMMDQRGLTPEQTKQLKESFQPGTIEARHGKKGEAFVVTSGEKNASGIFSWVFVKQFSRNDMATACQDWLRVPG